MPDLDNHPLPGDPEPGLKLTDETREGLDLVLAKGPGVPRLP